MENWLTNLKGMTKIEPETDGRCAKEGNRLERRELAVVKLFLV